MLRRYRDMAMDAPEVVNLTFDLHSDEGKPYVGIEACWSDDDHARGRAWLEPLRTFGKTDYASIEPKPYGPHGAADHRFQAYNFRLCLTTVPENRVPITEPANYNPLNYGSWCRADRLQAGIWS